MVPALQGSGMVASANTHTHTQARASVVSLIEQSNLPRKSEKARFRLDGDEIPLPFARRARDPCRAVERGGAWTSAGAAAEKEGDACARRRNATDGETSSRRGKFQPEWEVPPGLSSWLPEGARVAPSAVASASPGGWRCGRQCGLGARCRACSRIGRGARAGRVRARAPAPAGWEPLPRGRDEGTASPGLPRSRPPRAAPVRTRRRA